MEIETSGLQNDRMKKPPPRIRGILGSFFRISAPVVAVLFALAALRVSVWIETNFPWVPIISCISGISWLVVGWLTGRWTGRRLARAGAKAGSKPATARVAISCLLALSIGVIILLLPSVVMVCLTAMFTDSALNILFATLAPIIGPAGTTLFAWTLLGELGRNGPAGLGVGSAIVLVSAFVLWRFFDVCVPGGPTRLLALLQLGGLALIVPAAMLAEPGRKHLRLICLGLLAVLGLVEAGLVHREAYLVPGNRLEIYTFSPSPQQGSAADKPRGGRVLLNVGLPPRPCPGTWCIVNWPSPQVWTLGVEDGEWSREVGRVSWAIGWNRLGDRFVYLRDGALHVGAPGGTRTELFRLRPAQPFWRPPEMTHDMPVLAWSPDGSRVALSTPATEAHLVDLADPSRTLRLGQAFLSSRRLEVGIAWSRDGDRVVTSSYPRKRHLSFVGRRNVRIFDACSGDQLEEQVFDDNTRFLAQQPLIAQQLGSSSWAEGPIVLFDPLRRTRVELGKGDLQSVLAAPDRVLVAYSLRDLQVGEGTVRIVDRVTGETRTMSLQPVVGRPMAFSPGLEWLAVGERWSELTLVDVESGQVLRTGVTLASPAAWVSEDQIVAAVDAEDASCVLVVLKLGQDGTVTRRQLIDGNACYS